MRRAGRLSAWVSALICLAQVAAAHADPILTRNQHPLVALYGLPLPLAARLPGAGSGDIGATLRKLDEGLTAAPIVSVSCARLIRVDFIAAGDLLNWVLAKRNENRVVHLVEAHRLVALFFCAMGINEHAKVQVRKV